MRSYLRIKRYQKLFREHIFFLFITALLFGMLIGWFLGKNQVVSAKVIESSSEPRSKYFTSIYIENGDTLWDIAKENITSEYATIQKYIHEIKKCNNLHSNNITEGCYLLIPYYAEKPRN